MSKETKDKVSLWVRTVCQILALVNSTYIMTTNTPIINMSDGVYHLLSVVLLVISGVLSHWTNNNFTAEAKEAQKLLDELKNNRKAKRYANK